MPTNKSPLQLTLLGETGSGKTAAVLRDVNDEFIETHVATVATDSILKTLSSEHTKTQTRIMIYATSGEPKWDVTTPRLCSTSQACVIFVNLGQHRDEDSMRIAINPWLTMAQQPSQNRLIFLMGSKTDLLPGNALAAVTNIFRQVAANLQLTAFTSSAKDDACQLLGQSSTQDTSLKGSLLSGITTLTAMHRMIAGKAFNPAPIQLLLEISSSTIPSGTLEKSLTDSHCLQTRPKQMFAPKGSQSIVDINKLLKQSKDASLIDGFSMLTCLSDEQKTHFYDWLVAGCLTPAATDTSTAAVIHNIFTPLLPVRPIPGSTVKQKMSSTGLTHSRDNGITSTLFTIDPNDPNDPFAV